jgi:hypothetical protein
MTPYSSSCSGWNSIQVFRPKPKNHPATGFEAQTTKLPEEAYLLCLVTPKNFKNFELDKI